MPSELFAVLATLGGVVVGGLVNYFATRSAKTHEWRLALARDRAASRQKLYAEFLVESQRLVVQAREEKISSLSELNPMNSKFAEVQLVAPAEVLKEAQQLADYALTSHGAPPAAEAANFFKLKESFISAARADIERVLRDA